MTKKELVDQQQAMKKASDAPVKAAASSSYKLSADTYKKYENEYANWKKTGSYSADFDSWNNPSDLNAWKKLRSGKRALIDGQYVGLDSDTYKKYDTEYENWKNTGAYSSDFDSWKTDDSLNAYKTLRQYDYDVSTGARPSEYVQSILDGYNPDILNQMALDYQASWEYDVSDPEDIGRMQQGLMPKANARYFNQKNEMDRYLYAHNLPNGDYFSDRYNKAAAAYNQERNKRNGIVNSFADAFNTGNDSYQALVDDFLDSLTGAYRKKSEQQGGGRADLGEDEIDEIIAGLLTSGKHDSVAPYFKAGASEESETPLDAIELYVRGLNPGKDYSIYDDALTALQNGETPSDDFFEGYKQSDFNAWLKQSMGFSQNDLMEIYNDALKRYADEGGDPEAYRQAVWSDAMQAQRDGIQSDIDEITQKIRRPGLRAEGETRDSLKAQREKLEKQLANYDSIRENSKGMAANAPSAEAQRRIEEKDYTMSELDEDPELWAAFMAENGFGEDADAADQNDYMAALDLEGKSSAHIDKTITARRQELYGQMMARFSKLNKFGVGGGNVTDALAASDDPQIKKMWAEYEALGQYAPKWSAEADKARADELMAEAKQDSAFGQLITADNAAGLTDGWKPAYQKIFDAVHPDLPQSSQGGEPQVLDVLNSARRGIDQGFVNILRKATNTKTGNLAVENTLAPEAVAARFMTDEEQATYDYYAENVGPGAATKYFNMLRPTLYARKAEEDTGFVKQVVEDSPLIASIAGTVNQFYGGAESLSVTIGKAFGEEVYPYDPRLRQTRLSSQARQMVSADMNQAGAFFYNTGMSMLDNLARLPFGQAGLAVMGGNIMAGRTDEMIAAGATSEQAIRGGAAAALIEVVTEKVSLDRILSPKMAGSAKKVIIEVLKQSGVEASEEMASEVLNLVADTWNRADQAEYRQDVLAYMAQGMTEEQANAKALGDFAIQLAAAGASGALSGLFFGAGSQAVNTYSVGRHSGGNIVNSLGVGQRTIAAYEKEVAAGRTLGEGVQIEIARDVNKLGFDSETRSALLSVSDQFARQPESWVTSAGQKAFAALAQIVADNGARAHTWTAQREAQITGVQTRLSSLYSEVQAAYNEAATAIEAGDLVAATTMQAKVNKALSKYQDAYANAEAKNKAQEAAHEQKLHSAQQTVVAAAAELEAQIPAEVEHQRQLAAELDGQEMAATSTLTASNTVEQTAAGNNAYAETGVYRAPYAAKQDARDVYDIMLNGGYEDGRENGFAGINNADRFQQSGKGNRSGSIGQTRTDTEADRVPGRVLADTDQTQRGASERSDSLTENVRGRGRNKMAGGDSSGVRGGHAEAGRGNRVIPRTAVWTKKALNDLEALRDSVNEEPDRVAGRKAYIGEGDIVAVHEVDDVSQSWLDRFSTWAGQGLLVYNTKSGRTDIPHGFTYGGRLHVRYQQGSVMLFHAAHELAELSRDIRAAGLSVEANEINGESFQNYLRIKDSEDVRGEEKESYRKEFVCDAFGAVAYWTLANERVYDQLGITDEAAVAFEKAFADCLSSSALEEMTKTEDDIIRLKSGGVRRSETNVQAEYDKFAGIPHVKVVAEQEVFDNARPSEYHVIARDIFRSRYVGRTIGGSNLSAYVNGKTVNKYTAPHRFTSDTARSAKMRATPELAELLNAAEFLEHKEDKGHHPEAVGGWDYYQTRFSVSGRLFEGVVNIALTSKGMLLYDIDKIKDITDGKYGSGVNETRTTVTDDIFTDTISDEANKNNPYDENSKFDSVKRSTSDISVSGSAEAQARSAIKNMLERYDVPDAGERAKKYVPRVLALVGDMLSGDGSMDTIAELQGIVRDLIETATTETAGKGYAKDQLQSLRSYFKGSDGKQGFSLTSRQKQEVESVFGSYKDFVNSVRGITGVSDSNSTKLDQLWSELCDRFPGMFNPDANEADMPIALADAIERLKDPATHNPYGDDIDSAVQVFTSELVERVQAAMSAGERESFTDDYGNNFSYTLPAVRQHADGTYFVDVSVGGVSKRFAADSVQELREKVREDKKANIIDNPSRSVRVMREAMDLLDEAVTPVEYWERNRENWDGERTQVFRHLRGLCLKNGMPMGGALSTADLDKITENARSWKDPRAGRYALASPMRIFEDKGDWRAPGTFENVMKNIAEGNSLRDTYATYALQKNAEKTLWMERERKNILSACNGGGIRESTLVQLFGEKIITEEEAASAIYDNDHMVVPVAGGIMVFDRTGQLYAMSDSKETWLFDKHYRQDMRKAYGEISQQLKDWQNAPEHNRNLMDVLRDRLGGVKPVKINGRLVTVTSATGVTVLMPRGGKTLLSIENGKHADMDIVRKTTATMQDFYNRVFEYQSRALIENGYDPVEYRENYFPHQARIEGGLAGFVDSIAGPDLPTPIAGMTATLTPGRPFTTHLLQRMGSFTEFDAMRGFNKYVQAAGDLIYLTPVVQRIRQLERHLRDMSEAAGEDGDAAGISSNARFVAWLHDYGNRFANKKCDLDRGWEDMFGREVYTLADHLSGLYSAAAIAGNISSATSNLVSYVTSLPTLDPKYAGVESVKALLQCIELVKGEKGNYDGFADKIPFLVSRRGAYENILTRGADKVKAGGGKVLYAMFTATDYLTTEAVARAKYAELRAKGMDEAEAISRTDAYCVKMFAERSAQMAPKFFSSKLMKVFGQFQLEVTNQLSHFRDIDRGRLEGMLDELLVENGGNVDGIDFLQIEQTAHKHGAWKDWARKLAYLVLLSLWGGLTRWMMGRDQTWNPAGMVVDAVRDYKEGGISEAEKGVAENVSENIPFVSFLVGGGRVPVMGGVDNAVQFVKDVFDKDMTAGQKALSGAKAITSFIPAGGQGRKLLTGHIAAAKGGYYTDDGRLRYPIADDDMWKAILFGPSAAAPEGYEWGDTLSASRTESYKELVAAGLDPENVFDLMLNYNGATNATKALSVLTADSDKSGEPDFSEQSMQLIAAVMGWEYDPKKDGSVEAWARKATKSYTKPREGKDDLTDEEVKNLTAIDEFWEIFLGMK